MRKFTQLLTLAALMFVPWVAIGQNTLTVADGTSTNSYVPVYGYYADAYLRSQIIYPASEIASCTGTTAMNNGSITEMKFYASQSSVSLDGSWEIKMMETPAATLSSFVDMTGATTVYTGTVGITSNEMTITLTTPYTYNGGNLLVEFSQTSTSSAYPTTTFYGVNATGASVQGYSYSSVSAISATGRDFMPKVTFTFTGGTTITCPAIQATSITSVDSVSATLAWTDTVNTGASYTIGYYTGSGDTSYTTSNTTTATITGLDANTTYNYFVIVNCSSTDNSLPMGGSFKTTCGTNTVPYSTGFEGLSTGSQPDCWEAIVTGQNGSNTFPCAYSYASNTHTGSVYYEFESGSGSSNVEIAALPVMENISSLKMSMWVSSSSSYPCTLEVGVMEGSTFVPVDTLNLITFSGGSNWKQNYNEYTTYFANYSGNGNRIAIRATRSGSGQFTLFIDDVTVEEFAGCYPITNLHATAIDSADVTLAWNDNMNGSATYSITYWKDGSTDTLNTTTSDTTVTISGLDANSIYHFIVTAQCGSGDASPIEATYRTECGAMTMPFFDDFDNYANGAFPPCWQRIRAHGTDPSVNNQYHHSGSQSMYLASNSDTTLFVTPTAIPLDGNNIYVRYHAYMNYSSYSTMTKWIKAGVMTDPNNMSTFIALDSLEYHNFNNVFEEREFATTALDPDSAYYVAWMYYCNYSYTNTGAIDDVYISEMPSCLRISSLAITDADSERLRPW